MPESQLQPIDWLYQNTFLDYNKQHEMWKVYKFCFASPTIIFLFSKSSLRLITNHVIIGVFKSFISLIIKFSVYISAIHSVKVWFFCPNHPFSSQIVCVPFFSSNTDKLLDCLFSRVIVLDKGCVKEFDSPTSLLKSQTSIFYGMAKDAGLV